MDKNFQQTKPNNYINSSNNNNTNKSKGYIVIPYVQGLCKKIKINIYGKYGIQTYFKGNRIIKNILVSPKDTELKQYKSGIIHWYKCKILDCDDEYIGESARTFGERHEEHH